MQINGNVMRKITPLFNRCDRYIKHIHKPKCNHGYKHPDWSLRVDCEDGAYELHFTNIKEADKIRHHLLLLNH